MKDLATDKWVSTSFVSGPDRGCWLDVYSSVPKCAEGRLAVRFETMDAVASECFLRIREEPVSADGEQKLGYVVWPETIFVRVEPVVSRPS